MPQWANRAIADAESSVQAARPVNGQRLDQILAELKARPRSTTPPTARETPRNVTPLHPPLMAELHSLQTRIDHLAEKMDAERLAAAITDLSDKVAALNAERSLGEAEMRLLRSIRRSLDDLIYHMTTATPEETVEPTLPPPAEPQMEPQPKVFGRRMVPPARQRPLHDDAIWPQPQSPAPRRVGDAHRGWHVSQLIARRPFMSVAAAFAAAIMVAAGVTQWMPFQPDNTGSIRTATTRPVNQDAASPPPAAHRLEPLPMSAAPAPSSTPTPPAPVAMSPSNAPQTMAAVSRSPEDMGGVTAYQAGVRLADGPARDYRGAITQFEKAGDMPAAQFRLALLYERGQGTGKNLAMARALYQKAAEKGHVRAMHNLGVLYADGIDGKPDYASAAEWFRRAADYGLRDSQYNLATLTARGLGVPKNLPAAYMWYALAAAQGDADAARQRDEISKALDAAALKASRAAADSFRPKPIDPTVNQAAATP